MKEKTKVVDVKIEYCRKCGSSLDRNRCCTGCGKQYFHINKKASLKIYTVCVTFIAVIAICCNVYNFNLATFAIKEQEQLMDELESIQKIFRDPQFADDRAINPSYSEFDEQNQEYVTTTAFEKNSTVQSVRSLLENYQSVTRSVRELQSKNSDLSFENSLIKYELKFYENNAVIVTSEGSKYHKYGCYHIKNRPYFIFNITEAKRRDYTPCADCWT